MDNLQNDPNLQGEIRKKTFRERLKFHSYKFDENQTIDNHLDTLKRLASTCDFGGQTEYCIIDKILTKYNIIEILDSEPNITLERVVEIIKFKETVNRPSESLHEFEKVQKHKVISKAEIDIIVDSFLKDCSPKSLKEVENFLEHKFQCSLSQNDRHYIEVKYTEILIDLWLNETSENAMDQSDKSVELIEGLNDINSLEGCFTLCMHLPYNNVMKELYKYGEYIKRKENLYVLEFKSTFLTFSLVKSSYLKCEINFCTSFIRTMKRAKCVEDLCSSLNVTSFLESVEDDAVSFKKFVKNILDLTMDNSTNHLKSAAKAVADQDRFFLVKNIKVIIKDYLKSAVLTESLSDGRKVLKVEGKHVLLSKVLEDIERSHKFSHIEEVRFINVGVLYIDEDLNRTIWYGKNIVVFAETIIVSMDRIITWDVSGQNSENEEMEPAATSNEGVGLEGAEGKPGESGGNILLIYDEIENASNLKIVSNGGKGGNGQDGGDGHDGADGDYLDEINFKKNFPPVCKFRDEKKQKNLNITKMSVIDDIQSMKIGVLGGLNSLSKDDFDNIFEKRINILDDIYFELRTKTGCQVFFSFYNGFGFSQSFLLHKGSYGEPGKDGGQGGIGGKGGFAGEVKIVPKSGVSEYTEAGIVICASNGEDGKCGQTGKSGKPGITGLDRAYMDSTKPKTPLTLPFGFKIPFTSDVQFPQYFIPNHGDCQRLSIKYYRDNPKGRSVRVWCPRNKQYAEITKVKRDLHQNYIPQHLSLTKVDTVNQHKKQVIRKKTISLDIIMRQYVPKTSMTDFNKLNSIEANIKRILEEIADEKEMVQKTQTAKEIRITRKIEFLYNDQREDYVNLISENINLKVSEEPPVVDQGLTKEPIKDVKYMVSSKYQLEALENLEQTFHKLNYSSRIYNTCSRKSVGSVESTLKIFNDQESFSVVEDYICNDSMQKRHKIAETLEEFDSDGRLCLQIFNIFLNSGCEIGNEGNFFSDTYLKAYQKHYNWFKAKKDKAMHIKLHPLLTVLKGTGNQKMYNQLVKAITEQNINLKIDVEHHICSDHFLNMLYINYTEEVNTPFVWNSILIKQETVITKLKQGIKHVMNQKGPISVFFREVLAHLYKTNILVYTINEYDQMVLNHNHNPDANEVVHILEKNNCFFRLKTDEGLSQLIRAHENKGEVCSRIHIHIDSVKEQESFKIELDKLISNSAFFFNDYNGVSKSTEIRVKINHMLMEDENIRYITNSFELEEDRHLANRRLQMLKHEYIGYQSFLYYIALHIRIEGKQLSVKELCCVVNCVMRSVVDSKTNLISWIIAAHNQSNWIVEFLLIKMEYYFKQLFEDEVKIRFRKNLHKTNREIRLLLFEKLSNDQSLVNIESAEEVLSLISQTPNYDVCLTKLSLDEWKYYLRDMFWSNQLESTGDWCDEKLKIASFYLATLENSVGKELCCKFIKVVKSLSNSGNSKKVKDKVYVVLDTLKKLSNRETLFNDKLLDHLSQAEVCKWEEVIDNECFSSGEERSLNQLSELIGKCANTSEQVRTNVDEMIKSVDKTKLLIDFFKLKNGGQTTNNYLLSWITILRNMFEENKILLFDKEKSSKTKVTLNDEASRYIQEMQNHYDHKTVNQKESDFLQNNLFEICLATVCASIYVKFQKTLRSTQLLAIITFLRTNGNVLGQVSTGEGKTFIIVAVAIMKALSGSKVDIITSSHVLAERDAEASKGICEMFNIEVGHNCSEKLEERQITYSKCCLVYGELSYFQRDFLLDRVYNKNIMGDRTFQTIVVDEVDSMLLDKANNVLYLSHDIPGLDKLEPVFVFIWRHLNMPSRIYNDDDFFNVEQLKDKILYHNMYGQIKLEDIRNFDLSLEEKYVLQTWEHLVEKGIIDSSGKILNEQFNYNDLINCCHRDHINYLLTKIINREKEFEVPNYLKSFVEDHLDKWIESAIKAINLKNNIDYVVDIDRSTDDNADRNPNIIIFDRGTGTDLKNSQWDQALHQFLQLKHGCRISPLTFKAVFVSNVSYLKKYETLIGLTGTLGTISDRDLLKEVYKVQFVTIPTAKAKNFIEEMPILCKSRDDWSTKIVETVYKVTKTRSALVICDSVKDVFTVKNSYESFVLKNKLPKRHIHTYTRDYEKLDISEKGLGKGHIVISTNLAGRGTDINLSDELTDAGGLHVCLSFLPSNSRIEEQAFGRAARNGQPGTGQLIFRDFGQNTFSRYIDLKKDRDVNEVFRVSDVRKYYETSIKPEENMFHEFVEKYTSLNNSKHCKEIKKILLMSCLDQWAFWLEKNSHTETLFPVSDLIDNISKLGEKDFDTWSHQIQDPFQLTKLGVYYLKQKSYDIALKLFDRVIKYEPVFSEAAYYYRACTKTCKDDINDKHLIISELKVIEKKLNTHMESSLNRAQFIEWLKDKNSRDVVQNDCYKEQQLIMSNTYEIFIESIKNIIGRHVTPEEFFMIDIKGQTEINNEQFGSVLFNCLVDEKIINYKIKDNITDGDLHFLSKYGICPKDFKKVLFILINSLDRVKVSELRDNKFHLKGLKKSVVLPSREIFWKELMSAGILLNEDKYVFVNHKRLNNVDPSLVDQIKNLTIDFNPPAINKVSLFLPEELGQLEESFAQCHWLFLKNMFKNKLGDARYSLLKQQNVILSNKHASFSSSIMENVELNYFDSITHKDFLKLGIPSGTADCIIKDLIEENVLGVKEKSHPINYALLINFEDIDRVELKTHKAYWDDVKSLLSHCFAFRIAIQKLQHVLPLCEGNYTTLCLPLKISLHKNVWCDLLNEGIIERTVNLEEIKSGKLQTMFSKSMNKERYIMAFSKIYNKERSEEIVKDLIQKEWLKKNNFNPRTIFSGPVYSINCNANAKDKKVQLAKPKELSTTVKSDSKTIELILQYQLTLCDNLSSIENELKRLAGTIEKVETPVLSLTSLETVLVEYKIPTSEIDKFILNGFDQVVFLEEKKYTKRMKIRTLCITMLALTEIAVGVYLECCMLGNPLGIYLITQGIDDIIFNVSCIFSGHFSWRSYRMNKLTSLIIGSITCYSSLRTVFGRSSAGLPLSTMKEKCLSALSNIKSSVSKLFKPQINQVTKTELVTNICKRVLVHAGAGIAQGASFALIHSAIESQLESLDESLTGFFLSEIETTIINHSIFESAKSLNRILGKKEAMKVIKITIENITCKFKNKLEKGFNGINLRPIYILIKRTVSNVINKKLELSDLVKIFEICQNVLKVITTCRSYYEEILTLNSNFLDAIDQELEKELNKQRGIPWVQETKKSELEAFDSKVLDMVKCDIREVYSGHIREKLLIPLLSHVGDYLAQYSSQMIVKTRKSFINNEKSWKWSENEIKKYQKTCEVKSKKKKPDFFGSEFDDISLQVLKTRKTKMALGYLISTNAPMDMSCLDLCFKVIPLALKQEGFRVPPLRVEIEKNGLKHTFCMGDTRGEVPTVHISPDANLSTNVKNNKILVKDVVNVLCKSIRKHYPEHDNLTTTLLEKLIVKGIDYYCSSPTSGSSVDGVSQMFEQDCVWKDPTYCNNSEINTECERISPYQHSYHRRGWMFNSRVDVDLRMKLQLTNLIDVQNHVNEGFETALGKINAHIHSIQSHLPYFNLVLDDLTSIKHLLTPPSPGNTLEIFQCFTVQYDLIVPIILTGWNRATDFNITLRLENGSYKNKTQQNTPLGPYIHYEIIPINNTKLLNKGLKGHVLLNIDCINTGHNIRDCHQAGELISSTPLPKLEKPRGRTSSVTEELLSKCDLETLLTSVNEDEPQLCGVNKECDIVIIGDSLFKYINEYIMLPKCNFESSPYFNANQVKKNVILLADNYKSVKCVVLFLGNDIVKTKTPEQTVIKCLFYTIEKVQKKMKNAKVVICSLTWVKQPVERYNEKISKVNVALKDYCSRKNVVIVNANKIICKHDMGKDGIHLNRSGYDKLGKHLSQVCEGILNLCSVDKTML